MKRLSTPKRVFTFTLEGSSDVLTKDDIPNLSESDKTRITNIYQNWLESETSYERAWRNHELSVTDFMMMPDATYKKVLIKGSIYESEVLAYRAALREYNLKDQDRPTRPVWFTQE
ncbi:phage tail assembly chaperone [Vibrio vulnificus]|nr:phage tail assembly chaperone [Vibrio vulnificus]